MSIKNGEIYYYIRIMYAKITGRIANKMLQSNCSKFLFLKKYRLGSLFDYSNKETLFIGDNLSYDIVCEPKSVNNGSEKTKKIEFIPDYVCFFENIEFVPSTDSIILDGQLLTDRFKYDRRADIVLGGDRVIAFNDDSVVLKRRIVKHLKGSYINMCYNGGGNIWHLMVDMLAKFRLINSLPELNGVPLLIDASLQKNSFAQKYIELFNQNHHDIVYVDNKVNYRADKLYIISLTYAFMRKEKQADDVFFVNSECSNYVRGIVLPHLYAMPYDKFFIKRGDGRLINEDEVVEFLSEKGYAILQPEKFDFFDELSLFFGAKCIIGSVGAAMTNLVYTNSNAKVICIGPNERVGLVNAYADMMHCTGADLYYCQADTVENSGIGTPGLKFKANLSELQKLIAE